MRLRPNSSNRLLKRKVHRRAPTGSESPGRAKAARCVALPTPLHKWITA